MEITVNYKNYDLDDACSIEQMLSVVLPSQAKGIAIAVNQNIISKSNWPLIKLQKGDQVMLIKATQGG
jgi:sulfur carrier protein